MRQIWLFVVSMFVLWPVGWEAAAIGDKPIDLVTSDLLPFGMPLIYLLARTRPTDAQLKSVDGKAHGFHLVPLLALIFMIYAMSLAGIGLGMSGEKVRIFSAFKLAKPFGFVLVGALLGAWVDPFEFFSSISRAFCVIVAMTMFFTVTDPNFPFGDWGRFVYLDYELAGYPNSPMSFVGCLVPLLLAEADRSRNLIIKIIAWSLAACAALMILGSMSRSSSIVLICGVAIYLVMTGRTPLLIVCTIIIGAISAIGFGVFQALQDTEIMTELTNRVQARLDRSIEHDDPSSGRFEIWALAIELWAENPVFGYLFESFSHFSEFDTPHQQYFEVLHKCGGLGLTIYMGTLASCLAAISRLLRKAKIHSAHTYQLQAVRAMLLGVLIGNLTQPNLTYSLTGNLVFLIFGCLCSARAVISLSKPASPVITKPIRPIAVPALRIAG